MHRKETFLIQPSGRCQHQEQTRLSPLDFVITQHYNNYALIFELDKHTDTSAIVETFRSALEATLSQCRHVAGTIEKNRYGDFSIFSRPDSSVPLVIQCRDAPGDEFPSYSDIQRAHFVSGALGDPSLLTIPGMAMSSDASPRAKPAVAGFQLTFIRGGLVLTINVHHFAMDAVGASALVHHIASHCRSIVHGAAPPGWNRRLVDRSRFIPPRVPNAVTANPQQPAHRHPDWLPCSWLLFHISQSKLTELKRRAMPTDGSWISSYDAVVAFLWRVLSKNRAPIYKPDLGSPALFGESVNMRDRVRPSVPQRYQGNLQCGGLSFLQKRQLTLAEVISEARLRDIAAFIRRITDSVSQDTLQTTVATAASVSDPSNLHFRQNSMPPMSLIVTDWRGVDMGDAEFGFGRAVAVRQLSDVVTENVITIYPRRTAGGDSDYGLEVVVPFERHAVDTLIKDPQMNEFFTFRGFEAETPLEYEN
ncbi:Trichothecene 3-O-acetyltransferase [Madurella mycetomatis]|uniref:Trichothecene 3-O-acetyltransferase n=1 Tax=Madurella mycetomatis TaxID=100816 RepID=A0A175VYW6_9PEZI|nr:Trichothecene 3-O-acetyltransferase [Madurella mycetomatis]KXX80983.1 Trichothecene 3-O-acetyltransferase [Madurella mycetomatis]